LTFATLVPGGETCQSDLGAADIKLLCDVVRCIEPAAAFSRFFIFILSAVTRRCPPPSLYYPPPPSHRRPWHVSRTRPNRSTPRWWRHQVWAI